jgi:hypothetical protein
VNRPRLALFAAAACVLLAAAGGAVAEDPGSGPPVVVKVAPVTVSPGGRAETTVTLTIQNGIRIVAPGTVSRVLQPAMLAFDAADGVFVEPPTWPAGASWRAEKEDPEVKVYTGRLDLKVTLGAAPQAPGQEIALKGRLRYQPIDGNAFLKVTVLPLSMPVKVATRP